VLRQPAHRNHFHRLLTLVFNVYDRRGNLRRCPVNAAIKHNLK
jgi:hypothetical protein